MDVNVTVCMPVYKYLYIVGLTWNMKIDLAKDNDREWNNNS